MQVSHPATNQSFVLILESITVRDMRWPHGSALVSGSSSPGLPPGQKCCIMFLGKTMTSQCLSPPRCINGYLST